MSPHTDPGALLKLADELIAFFNFINEPPQYEDQRMVRDYRHELARLWMPLHGKINAALAASHGREGGERSEVRSGDAWSALTHDEIIKRLMAGVGMPNSVSLYTAFKQFANELHALAHSRESATVAQAPTNCDCGFSAKVCETNPCMRKKMATSGLNPEAKYPYCGTEGAAQEVQEPQYDD